MRFQHGRKRRLFIFPPTYRYGWIYRNVQCMRGTSPFVSVAMMAILCWFFCLNEAVGSEQTSLPKPQAIAIHPDGAVFDYRIALEPGVHRIVIPKLGTWQVQGADSWNVMKQVRLIEPLTVPLHILTPYQERRDALWVEAVALRNRIVAEENIAGQWTETTLARAELNDGFVDNWKMLFKRSGAMFKLLEQQNKDFLEKYDQLKSDCYTALEPVMIDHFGAYFSLFNGDADALIDVILDMDDNVFNFAKRKRLGRKGVEAKWAKRFKASSISEHWLQVTIGRDGQLALTRTVDGVLSWKVAQRLFLNERKATLRREAIIYGARELPVDVPLTLHESFLSGNLYLPPSVNRSVGLGARELPEQRRVIYQSDRINWSDFGDPQPGMKHYVISPLIKPATTVKRVLLAQDDLPLEIMSDEWVIIPDQNAVARRMVRLRTSEALKGSALHVIENQLPVGEISLPDVAAGGVVALFLQADNRIFMTSHTPWEDDPQRSSMRRRSGSSTRIMNLSQEALAVNVMLTQPVADHELVEVIHSDLSSSGGERITPGLWRYRVQLPPASESTVEHGWIIQTKGQVLLK